MIPVTETVEDLVIPGTENLLTWRGKGGLHGYLTLPLGAQTLISAINPPSMDWLSCRTVAPVPQSVHCRLKNQKWRKEVECLRYVNGR